MNGANITVKSVASMSSSSAYIALLIASALKGGK